MKRRLLVALAVVAILCAVVVIAESATPAKGKPALKKGTKPAPKPAPKPEFDDFGLSVRYVSPKNATRLAGHARTHKLKADLLIVRSRLPITAAKAKASAGVCRKDAKGKCKAAPKPTPKQIAAKKAAAKKAAAKKAAEEEAKRPKTVEQNFPKSALPPIPHSKETLELSKKRVAAGESFLAVETAIDTEAEEQLEAQEQAEAEAEAEALNEAISAEDLDSQSETDSEADAEADAEAEAELESELERRRKEKAKKKAKAKAAAKRKRKAVPVLVSRPSALVRRKVKTGKFKALRSYARHVNSNSASIHVIGPHHHTKRVKKWIRKTVSVKGKDGKTTKKVKRVKIVKIVDTKRKRKIELAAMLDVRGSVKYGPAPNKQQKQQKNKHSKSKKGDKSKSSHNNKAAAAKAASGTAFIEDLMIVSKRGGAPKLPRANLGAVNQVLAASRQHVSVSVQHTHTHEHDYHHQWRLVYDDVNHGWMTTSGPADTDKPIEIAAQPKCGLRHAWSRSPVPSFVPRMAFDGASLPAASQRLGVSGGSIYQSFGDLPEHDMIAVSGTFHFLGAWRGEIGYAKVNGAVVWVDTASVETAADSALPLSFSVPFRVVVPHSESDVSIVLGSTLSSDSVTACWAIDDFAISVSH